MVSTPKQMRSSSYVFWGVAIALVALAIVALRSFTQERVPVRTAKVTVEDLTKSSSTNGKVEPMEDFKLTAQTAGQVEDVEVSIGQHVSAGQLLLRLDDKSAAAGLAHANSALKASEQMASAMAQGGSQEERNTFAADLSRAQLQRGQDAASLGAVQKLQKEGAASAGEVAAAQHRLDVDDNTIQNLRQRSTHRYGQADRARSQADLADARAAVTAAQGSYANANIRTPISGTVYYLPVSRFDTVNVGDDLVSVADLRHLKVIAYFDEPEVGNLKNGQPVKIVWEARPDKVWHGHISQVPTTIISYGTRNVGECFITVDDSDGTLQPNANVLITVTTAEHRHVLVVPHESIHLGQQPFVYRVMQNKLVRTPVRTGLITLTQVEIVSGLAEGDVVARNAINNRELTDGLKITVAE